ncbi:TlpA family protein disulfide reductase [Anoxybacteroides tepidamans]|uniref:TlpA family protein disulfide reductase n=1 Tax=Anoxybacteroides tepidamans TaxID=265948 RepID=UPI000485CFBD|nr:hypothetical protein [Anoxybacillus tepidamans]
MLNVISYILFLILSISYSLRALQTITNMDSKNSAPILNYKKINYSKNLVGYQLKGKKGETAFFEIHPKYLNIVVILNSNCPHCIEHFEEFWNILTYRNLKVSLQILINESSDKLIEYLDLVDPHLSVFQYNNDLIDEFQIPYYPAFIILNQQGKIEFITPDVYELDLLFLRRDSLLINS